MNVKLEALVKKFENLCITHATGGGASYEEYERERGNLLSQPELLPHLPAWVSKCRSGGHFWALMKATSPTYAGRRKFIWESLHPTYQWIARGDNPLDTPVETMLKVVNSDTIASVWAKARERQLADPPGAITAARSMVESTCKHILEELGVAYENDGNLPKLYKLTAKNLKLGVDQHDEQVLKQILGACSSAVDGLASLRNQHGDAHGPGKKNLRPAVRHAALAVNLAGTLCSFVVATYEARTAKQSDSSIKAEPKGSGCAFFPRSSMSTSQRVGVWTEPKGSAHVVCGKAKAEPLGAPKGSGFKSLGSLKSRAASLE